MSKTKTTSPEPTLDDVQRALSRPLPGLKAQLKMVPQPYPEDEDFALPSNCRQGGVLILLYPRGGQLHFVLTRRTHKVRSHKGQISLPGGAREEEDESLVQTALRENFEELGIAPNNIRVIGQLSTLYTLPSNYCIYPFVAHSSLTPLFDPDPVEVAQVIEVPLALLLDPSIRQIEYRSGPAHPSPRRVPFFNIHGQKVWGATAMILSELVTLLQEERGESKSHSFGREQQNA